jgi:hypothetical protein
MSLHIGSRGNSCLRAKARSAYEHILTLGLELLWLGKTLYLLGFIVECLSRTANLIRDSHFSQLWA